MSFVLNALRRADAERERGGVPDLHAHEAPAPGAATAAARPWLVWALAAAATALLLGLAGAWWLRNDAPGNAPPPAPPSAAPAAVAAAPAVPSPARPAPPAPPAPAAPAAPPAPAAVPAALPQVLIRIETAPAPAPPAKTPPRDKAAAAAAEPPIVKWKDLPEAQRRAMPPLVFGGAMDSPLAANRMLVINGRVVREGEEAERGVVLERIRLNSAILRYKDQRIEVSY